MGRWAADDDPLQHLGPGGYSPGPWTLRDSDEREVHMFGERPGHFRMPVEPGQGGRLWKFDRCAGRRLLMTVPPYLARSAAELLLPAEVVARDSSAR